MKDLVQRFPEQLEEALRIGEQASISPSHSGPIRNVIITGLGGSGYRRHHRLRDYRERMSGTRHRQQGLFPAGFPPDREPRDRVVVFG